MLASSRLWRRVVDRLSPEYPDIEVEQIFVDACAMALIRRPSSFDVIVTENMFGDILTDEASMLAGSLGMLPSASLGTKRTKHGQFGLYEPIHGTATHHAGKNTANPLATILSAALLLRYSLGLKREANAVERAVQRAVTAGYRTKDIAGKGKPSYDERGWRGRRKLHPWIDDDVAAVLPATPSWRWVRGRGPGVCAGGLHARG